MSYPPPPGYGQQPQQPGYPPQQPGGYAPQPQQPYGQPSQPGFGAPQQPGYPPQPPAGPYGAPPPMPPASGGGGGMVGKILGIVGVLVLGIGFAIFRFVISDSNDSSDTGSDTTLSNDEVDAAEEAAVGDCMSDALESADADLVVPCEDATAYWTITKVSDDSGAEVDYAGELTDPSIATSVCGQEYMGWAPGELWKSFQYVYTEETSGTGGPVDYLYCVEAIDKEDADGGRPVVPDTGACTDDSLRTFDCSNVAALYLVDEVETYDPPIEETAFDQTTALGGCPNSDYYATPVTGGDGLIYLAYCSSDNG